MSSQKKKGMNLERKQNLTGWAFLMPATILIAWMSFYPMIQAFILSLRDCEKKSVNKILL